MFFFFNDTATTEIYTLSLHDALPISLGRAIVRKPEVFLFDEPLSNLDAKMRVQMRTEIHKLRLRLQTTFIYVTHDQLEAMSMGDKIAVISEGVVQQIGNPSDIYDHPSSLFVASFVGSPAMNVLNCIYSQEGGRSFLIVGENDFKLDISDALGKDIQKNATSEELILGIRAEDIFVRKDAAKETIQTEVYVVEPLGSENIIDLKIGDNRLRAKTLPTVQPGIGQPIYMWFDKDRMHVFDRSTEKAIS